MTFISQIAVPSSTVPSSILVPRRPSSNLEIANGFHLVARKHCAISGLDPGPLLLLASMDSPVCIILVDRSLSIDDLVDMSDGWTGAAVSP